MWFIYNDEAGLICSAITYLIVLTVQVGMIRIALWEGLLQGEIPSIVNLFVFQYHCAMIFWSHFKCMTTQPGVLPKNYDTLSIGKVTDQMANTII